MVTSHAAPAPVAAVPSATSATLDKGQVEVIAGINLPMLIKLTGLRSTATLAEAVPQAQLAGRKYINVASQLLDADKE
jgi:PTS system mannose-specific IIA component